MPNTRTLRCFLDRLKTAHLGMGTAFWCWCPPSTRSGRARPGMNNNSARSEHQTCLKKTPIKVNKLAVNPLHRNQNFCVCVSTVSIHVEIRSGWLIECAQAAFIISNQNTRRLENKKDLTFPTYILTSESPRTWNADSAQNRWEHLLSHRLTPRRTSSSLRFTHLMKRILGSLVKATALQKSQYHCNLLLVMYRSVPKKTQKKKTQKRLWSSVALYKDRKSRSQPVRFANYHAGIRMGRVFTLNALQRQADRVIKYKQLKLEDCSNHEASKRRLKPEELPQQKEKSVKVQQSLDLACLVNAAVQAAKNGVTKGNVLGIYWQIENASHSLYFQSHSLKP